METDGRVNVNLFLWSETNRYRQSSTKGCTTHYMSRSCHLYGGNWILCVYWCVRLNVWVILISRNNFSVFSSWVFIESSFVVREAFQINSISTWLTHEMWFQLHTVTNNRLIQLTSCTTFGIAVFVINKCFVQPK